VATSGPTMMTAGTGGVALIVRYTARILERALNAADVEEDPTDSNIHVSIQNVGCSPRS
jgi:hypothetical protein